MTLTKEQWELNRGRIEEHKHSRYEVDLRLAENFSLNGFIVLPNVLRPEKTSAIYLAKFLYSLGDAFKDRIVLDMGCGTGIQGIVTAFCGAKTVIFSDIFHDAVVNTRENVNKFKLETKSKVYEGDLFSKTTELVDVIIFNHPFFAEKPIKDIPSTISFFDEGDLLQRFLREAPQHLNVGGYILMPYFHFAGEVNNPEIQAPKHGYDVKQIHQINVDDGNIQKGMFSVFELRKIKQ